MSRRMEKVGDLLQSEIAELLQRRVKHPVLADAMERVPMLAGVGWQSFFCGPESFTPDGHFIRGEAPELENFFVGAGFRFR